MDGMMKGLLAYRRTASGRLIRQEGKEMGRPLRRILMEYIYIMRQSVLVIGMHIYH